MKINRMLIAVLAMLAVVLSSCKDDDPTVGIDSGMPAPSVFYDAANSAGKTIAVYWNPMQAISAGATSFTVQLVKSEDGAGDVYDNTISQTLASVDKDNQPADKAKFENLARMYSQDPGTMMRGGEMDPSTLEQLDPAFGAALEKMRPGQISEVVESQFGFHIIQLLDKRGRLYHFRHILLRPVYTTEELGGSLNTLDSLVKVIRKDSITFERAALLYSDDAQSKMNGGIVSNHDILERFNAFDAKLTVTKFLKEDFGRFKSLDDYNALNRLKPGEISEAYLTEDMLGNQMAKIVKLVEVIPTHTASLNEDYLRLEEMALQDKQERVFKEWLSKKIDGMYVYISPEFRNGEFENKHWVK